VLRFTPGFGSVGRISLFSGGRHECTSILEDRTLSIHQDFVVDRWSEVQASEEFEQGCAEVAAGEYVSLLPVVTIHPNDQLRWGTDGGKTLMALFRRLRSPAPTTYTRG
jgi:hypothetical protein